MNKRQARKLLGRELGYSQRRSGLPYGIPEWSIKMYRKHLISTGQLQRSLLVMRRLDRRQLRAQRRAQLLECQHYKLRARVKYDPVAAQGLDSSEIRQRWPRFYGRCPDCNGMVICYASFEHYVAGDW